jgi:hypothetical protein
LCTGKGKDDGDNSGNLGMSLDALYLTNQVIFENFLDRDKAGYEWMALLVSNSNANMLHRSKNELLCS